ncbi:MAG: IS91 family transposase [Thiogranum sp.]
MTAAISLQAILGRFPDPGQRLSPRQGQVCAHIQACRTAALGGVTLQCDRCAAVIPHYFACRDRHCPHCQQHASRRWCERQQQAVLPVTYYHVVFTLPHSLNPWVQLHPERLCALWFQTVWATLKAFAVNPKDLGGEPGMTAVLHTWGQTLNRHVHLHCLIPGGVFTAPGRWRAAKSNYLFPLRALSRQVRGRMVSALRLACQRGKLHRVTRPAEVDRVLDQLMHTDRVVYSKACVSHTQTVVAYLARYTHRIAITEARLLARDNDSVTFRYQDYRRPGQHQHMPLSGAEFIRRFLLHVLPKGFMRIRHFGFLANRCRAAKLNRIRIALEQGEEQDETTAITTEPAFDGYPCPRCRGGYARVRYPLAPVRWKGG